VKRHVALVRLSREHHAALVLAKRAQRLAGEAGIAATTFAAGIEARFAAELEPHFRVEETRLLPAMISGGAIELVERTSAEHAELRDLARRLGAGDIALVARFAELLAAHVRFEEGELFPAAETMLDAETLARCADHPPT
jgi:hypothetical protein